MKTTKLSLAWVIAISIFICCKSNTTNQFNGKWQVISVIPIASDSVSISPGELAGMMWLNTFSETTKVMFQDDNQYAVNNIPSGMYSFSDEKLILLKQNDTTAILSFHLLNDTLNLTSVNNDYVIRLVKLHED